MTMFRVKRETDKHARFVCEATSPHHAALKWARSEWDPFPNESEGCAVSTTLIVSPAAGGGQVTYVTATASLEVVLRVRREGREVGIDDFEEAGP